MGKWKIYTPEGFQDILFEECYNKKNIESKLRNYFRKTGYFELETPTVEFYDVFSSKIDGLDQESVFKFFDQQGRILVLRPDVTVPVARVFATKQRNVTYPVKCFYISNTFKYNELGGGKQKEYTQAGVEVLGVNSPEADAEVIVSAINSIKECGLENFQVDIGQVDFFKGLMEEVGLEDEDTEQMRMLIDSKDYLGLEELVENYQIDGEVKEIIFSLPKLFGSIDVIEKIERITKNERSIRALENLKQTLSILEDYGVSKYVSVDLGMLPSLGYYTGIIFKGFTYGAGFPILSGGRYDKLVENFGDKTPATGFSVGINMIMMALDRQKIEAEKPNIDTLVYYDKNSRKTAFKIVNELRQQGVNVEVDISNLTDSEVLEYAEKKEIGGVIKILDDEKIEVIEVLTKNKKITSITELLGK